MIKRGIIPALAFGHGLNDLLAGYFLGRLVQAGTDPLEAGLALLLYNLLAFGGQYPVALWLEKLGDRKKALVGAYMLNIAAVALFVYQPAISIVLAGIASAVYHVAGGSVCAEKNKALHIGLFAAPGVAGLILGGFWAWKAAELLPVLLPLTIFFLLLLMSLELPVKDPMLQERQASSAIPDKHDIVMILLLTVIVLRSAVWNIYQLIHENNFEWLIAIAIAAFTGKIMGGWIADRIGWRLYIYISLFTALPLVSFFKDELILFCIGIGLLQSGIPATTALLIQSVDGRTERGVGLSFGTAIILGAFVFAVPSSWYVSTWIIPAMVVAIMLVLMLLISRMLWLIKRGLTMSQRHADTKGSS